MPLSATSHARLQQFQQDNPARFDELVKGVKAGDIAAADAAAEIPGVSPADLMEVVMSGLDAIAGNADAQALGRAGSDAATTFGGLPAGGTLAAKGMIFDSTLDTHAAAVGALKEAVKRQPVGFRERVGEMLPEFRGGTAKSALKALGMGGAAAGGAFFINPLLSPVALVVGFYMGMKGNALPGEKATQKDPITADEGAAIKAAFDGASEAEKGAMAAAVANFKLENVEMEPDAKAALDEIAAYASSPAGESAQRFLDLGAAVQSVLGEDKTDPAELREALAKLSPDELEEVRPFLWDAVHDKLGIPNRIAIEKDDVLVDLLYSDKGAAELAQYMVASFVAHGSAGGEEVTLKEVNLLLRQLDRFDQSVSLPAAVAAGDQLAQMKISPKAATRMADVIDAINAQKADA